MPLPIYAMLILCVVRCAFLLYSLGAHLRRHLTGKEIEITKLFVTPIAKLALQLSSLTASHVCCFPSIYNCWCVSSFSAWGSSLTRNRFAYDIVHIF
jgi:hypothetical protein